MVSKYLKLVKGRENGPFCVKVKWVRMTLTRRDNGRSYYEFECQSCGYLKESRSDSAGVRCPACELAAETLYYSVNAKLCKSRNIVKDLKYYSIHSMAADGLRDSCIKCRNSKWSAYNSSNRDYINKLSKVLRNKHKGRYAAYSSKRRANKLSATPKWLDAWDKRYIQGIYNLSAWLTSLGKTIYEVDHIIPLQGEFASGLHVPNNLQILSRERNRIKGNRVELP